MHLCRNNFSCLLNNSGPEWKSMQLLMAPQFFFFSVIKLVLRFHTPHTPFLDMEGEKSMDKSVLFNISCAKMLTFFHTYPLVSETAAVSLDSCISYVTTILKDKMKEKIGRQPVRMGSISTSIPVTLTRKSRVSQNHKSWLITTD